MIWVLSKILFFHFRHKSSLLIFINHTLHLTGNSYLVASIGWPKRRVSIDIAFLIIRFLIIRLQSIAFIQAYGCHLCSYWHPSRGNTESRTSFTMLLLLSLISERRKSSLRSCFVARHGGASVPCLALEYDHRTGGPFADNQFQLQLLKSLQMAPGCQAHSWSRPSSNSWLRPRFTKPKIVFICEAAARGTHHTQIAVLNCMQRNLD